MKADAHKLHAQHNTPDPAEQRLKPGATVVVQVDGTPGMLHGQAGVGIVVRNESGRVLAWHSARTVASTCNAAEYQALIAGLQFAATRFGRTRVICLSDSRLVVDQMGGRSAVRSLELQLLHQRAQQAAQRLLAVEYRFIPRTLNRLADALAWEALGGRQRVVRSLQGGGSDADLSALGWPKPAHADLQCAQHDARLAARAQQYRG
ncbi:ribonuclease HI family protein [Candidatus Gracilibacteria bacterium]|nr:ribonuclease HI family protein [Candidatus Gracilibacteria bacterium]